MSPFWVSFRLAAGAALLALVLGALRVACWPERSAPALRAAALLVLAAPGACLAGGLLLSGVAAAEAMEGGLGLNRPEALAPTGLLLALGFAARFIYLPLRLAEEGLRALDPAMLEAAELAGHGRFSRGLGVALPNVWPHLAAACGLVFVFSLGELAVADKLAPPGAVPLSVWLFQEQHLGYSEAVFGMSLALALAAAAALLLAGAAAGWLERAGEAALR
jgi:ABC-type Fe3+ transport system permease subunit